VRRYRQLHEAILAQIAAASSRRHVAQLLFGFSCITFALSHFAHADFTGSLIPSWIPGHLALAYITGAGHAEAGVGIMFSIWPRLAATAEAPMLSSFVLLVHLPSIGAEPPLEWAPKIRLQWTALCIATV